MLAIREADRHNLPGASGTDTRPFNKTFQRLGTAGARQVLDLSFRYAKLHFAGKYRDEHHGNKTVSRNLLEDLRQRFAPHELKWAIRVPHPNAPNEQVQDSHGARNDYALHAVGPLSSDAEDEVGSVSSLP